MVAPATSRSTGPAGGVDSGARQVIVNGVLPSCVRLVLLVAAVSLAPGCRPAPGQRPVARVNGRVITAAELTRILPGKVDPARDDVEFARRYLEELIDLELFVQEAGRRGLDSVIEYQLELARKAFVTQELYNLVVSPAGEITPAALDSAHRELGVEFSLRVIEVEPESLARRLEQELAQGAKFESLAVRWSELPNAVAGGDAGWLPGVWLEAPVKAAVMQLAPGGHTPALPVYGKWQILQLEGRRAADPPPPPLAAIGGELTVRLRQFRQQGLAQEFLARLRRRLVFVPEGLAIVTRPADSITPAEQEAPVAIRDSTKYVKVGRLMHVLRRFPPALDTAMRAYAVRREIEEDLIYDEGLARKLDQLPAARESLAVHRRRLLYEALFRQAIGDSVEVSDGEVRQYYDEHRDNFPGADFAAVAPHIRQRLLPERRVAARREFAAGLRRRAKVSVDERGLRSIRQNPDGSWQ